MGDTLTFESEELIQDNFDEYLDGSSKGSNCATCLDTHKQFCWRWPGEMGRGRVSYIKLRDGLSLSIGSTLFNEPVQISFDNWHVPLTFSYGVSGNIKYTVTPHSSPLFERSRPAA
ncbi:MAG: hypothetical protein CSA32_02955 [Desulfobulbus propionicus]|nr:MAG: hypothetical protein CSA32_02955 [Desulfobulbus propionicus]